MVFRVERVGDTDESGCMSKFQVSFIDADKTMFVRDPMWDQLDNKNANALSEEFLGMLRHLAPTPWFVKNRAGWYGDVNIIVTGRLPEHKDVTMERVYELFCEVDSLKKKWSFVSVKWDDTFPTRKESYDDYVKRKAETLVKLYHNWGVVLADSNVSYEIRVYEDDKNVLDEMGSNQHLKQFLMNEDGTKAMPYGE